MPSEAEPDDADLLTAEEVIDLLLAQPFLRQVSATCALPALRVGHEWRFPRSELESWIARQLARRSELTGKNTGAGL